MLAIDLGVFHKKSHAVTFREAAGWSIAWIALAMTFAAGVYHFRGADTATDFVTGYLIEKSLSVDNLFVFVVLFAALSIPPALQHRVLFWGILSALVLRAAMILGGGALLDRFHWLIYVFGGFLILTGAKLFYTWKKGEPDAAEEGFLLRLVRRLLPTSRTLDGERFTTRVDGKWMATPLLLALVLIEITDVVFALDSIPAVFAVTRDPFIVFTSNVFAILGLRSLYFMLAGLVDRFVYLKVGLSFVLLFVGAKMLLVEVVKLPSAVSLAIIALGLGGSIGASLLTTRGEKAPRPRAAA